MASISVRKDTNKLFFNLTYLNVRCREPTKLTDTKANRNQLERQLKKMDAEIITGTFVFENYFPNSSRLEEIKKLEAANALINSVESDQDSIQTPIFSEFVDEWISENKLAWRRSHLLNIESIVNKHYMPYFGNVKIGSIQRVDLIKFRTEISKLPGRAGRMSLSNNRINKIMDPLKRIFEEASERYGFPSPFYKIKMLKIPKADVNPFNLTEVSSIISLVRKDYKNYYSVRFFTGMRTGEVDGLKWKYIDFEKRLIKVRETLVLGEEDYTKNDASQRDISMNESVYESLKKQEKSTKHLSDFVFCNSKGQQVNHNNITKRIWYPLLARLGLEKRRPYQTRHTTATLWLAAGESPEWIANQMGHTSTEMLFKIYSRFVPNLTRRDGSAFERLLKENL